MRPSLRIKEAHFGIPILAILLLAASVGCGSAPVAASPATGMEPIPPPRMVLGPGDAIDVKFFYVPELNESQNVRPDGVISLQLVGDVPVSGKTPGEVRDELFRLYTPHVKRPDVTVIVRSFRDRRIYVGGEVKKPGVFEMPGPLTALEAVMQAGGVNPLTAKVKTVIVVREKDGKRVGTLLDLRQALEGKPTSPYLLEPHDIVFVPQTTITKANQFIDQYINKMVPQFGFIYTQPAGDGIIGINQSR
ncbi:MAG: polysaccharide biosynthesis/export family protein [Candidatus Deferrimicrobiaceae bacterium]